MKSNLSLVSTMILALCLAWVLWGFFSGRIIYLSGNYPNQLEDIVRKLHSVPPMEYDKQTLTNLEFFVNETLDRDQPFDDTMLDLFEIFFSYHNRYFSLSRVYALEKVLPALMEMDEFKLKKRFMNRLSQSLTSEYDQLWIDIPLGGRTVRGWLCNIDRSKNMFGCKFWEGDPAFQFNTQAFFPKGK